MSIDIISPSDFMNTIMSLLGTPYLIEAPQHEYHNVPIRSTLPNRSTLKGSTNFHKIVAPPQNRNTPVSVLVPGTSNTNLTESSHMYRVHTWHVLFEIKMVAITTWFTSDGLGRRLLKLLSRVGVNSIFSIQFQFQLRYFQFQFQFQFHYSQ